MRATSHALPPEKLTIEVSDTDGEVNLRVPQQRELADWNADASLQIVEQRPNRLDEAENVTTARQTQD